VPEGANSGTQESNDSHLRGMLTFRLPRSIANTRLINPEDTATVYRRP